MQAAALEAFLAAHPAAIVAELTAVRGSSPREEGAFMLISPSATLGTIGGGALEYMVIDRSRQVLRDGLAADLMDIPLGPEIGQCCGGRTILSFRVVDQTLVAELTQRLASERAAFPDVTVFGAGHVGLALAQALAPLPLKVTLIDTRTEIDGDVPAGITFRRVAMPEAEVAKVRPGGAVVILTHDHALDFLIGREALARTDLVYVGMIGSKTKRATFASFLDREGIGRAAVDRLILPIGGNAVKDKRPAVIAAMVAAELLGVLLGSQS